MDGSVQTAATSDFVDRLHAFLRAVASFLLAATLWSASAGAAPRGWLDAGDTVFRTLAADADLPSSSMPLSIAQDRAGFIWIATETGVSRWDGAGFKSFGAQGPAGGLPEQSAKVVAADGEGRLWVGLRSEGLLRFDEDKETFSRPVNRTPLDRERVAAMSAGRGGFLWVASQGGVSRVDARTTRVDYGWGALLGLPPGAASWVAEDGRGRLRVVQAGGLFVQDQAGGRLRRIAFDGALASGGLGTVATAVLIDRSERIWVSTASSGVVVLDASGGFLRRVRLRSDVAAAAQPMVMAAVEVRPGVIWFDSHEGVFEVDALDGSVRRLHHEEGRSGSLADDSVNALMMDRSGVVWIGAASTLSIASPRAGAVAGVQGALGDGRGGRAYRAWAVASAPDGALWLGSQDDPVRIVERFGGSVRRRSGGEPARPRGVTSFAFLPDGRVFAASESGLYVMSPDGRVLGRVDVAPARHLLRVGDVLYVGGPEGLWRLDTRALAPVLTKAVEADRLTDPHVTALLATPAGELWIGTSRGLNRFEPATGRLVRFVPDPSDRAALGANYVNGLLLDGRHRLWIAMSGGLDVLDPDAGGRGRLRHLGRGDGLPNDTVDALLAGPDGSVWASTDGGVVRIDPRSFAVTTFREAEGLQSLAHWQGGATTASDGRLVFAGTLGLTIVDPVAAGADRVPVGLALTDLRIGSRVEPFGNDGAPRRIDVPPGAGSFTVEFGALDFAAADRIGYTYRLKGFEEQWTRADPAHRTARYTNLPPGDYILEIRASGRDGRAPGAALNVPVHVIAAWHQTRVFKGALALFVLAACWGAMQLRVHYIRRRERMLEAVIEDRTAELQASQGELKKLAYFDALTGLANRRMFTQNLERLLTPSGRQAAAFALILVDLDRFKAINDTLGHDAGDALLIQAAGRLVSSVRESDSVARLGGDEFAILVSGHIDERSLEVLCGRVVDAVASPIVFAGNPLDTSASLGVALFPDDGQTQDELYKAADVALYAAKRGGRNTWRRYSDLVDDVTSDPGREV